MFNFSAKIFVLPATHRPIFFALISPLEVLIPKIFPLVIKNLSLHNFE
jgi:hypothetical protein